jgi:hypothetical protein
MQEGFEPDGEIVKIAQGCIADMVGAIGGEKVSPDVMIDAALHILGA